MKTLFVIILLLFATVAYSADIVQVADIRDADGKWSNWAVQAVTWDNTVLTTIPDGQSISEQALQSWYFPVTSGWLKATFTRNKVGEYALRWSHDGVLWSEPTPVTIQSPGQAKKG